jgi:hypothetical protein
LLIYVCCAFVGLDNKFTKRLKNNAHELKEKQYFESMGIAGLYGLLLQESAGKLINEWGV